MSLRRWDPLADLLTMQGRGRAAGWQPPIDLYETADRYVVTAELPGLTRDQIHVEVLEGTLRLEGRRPAPLPRQAGYQQLERGHGPFARTFGFPQPVDADRVVAEFRDGVLTVTVPKAAVAETRRITVDTG
jgi:HSP20 family protein